MAAYKKSNSGYLPFIQKEKVASPYTDIQNRAKVDASLKCVFGSEKIHINSIRELISEFGPNGEKVFESDNGDSRVRLVGDWTTPFDGNGTRPATSTVDAYVEVTFYGTGLNSLTFPHTASDLRVTVDGGVEGGNISPSQSALLGGRNYNTRTKLEIVSGLSLGWHTVKIRHNSGNFNINGFEVVNEASQITVKSGKAHGNGYEYELIADELIDSSLGFDNVDDINIGTNGGRAIVYLDPSDGTVKKRLTKVDAAPAYLALADHTNEAPYRVINWREFGRNRGDDFSTAITGDDRAFTLDDGTTTLVGQDVETNGTSEGVKTGPSDFLVFTFVGTGLDINVDWRAASVVWQQSFEVDGIAIGNLSGTSPSNFNTLTNYKICSGLPYGTHTVKITRDTDHFSIHDFIIYQPKKPTLPEGAIELADYNVVADFVANGSSSSLSIGTGVIRKNGSREITYVNGTGGTIDWTIPSVNPNSISGFNDINTNRLNAYFELPISGTGFEYRWAGNTNRTTSATITLNGTALTAANFPTATFNTVGTGVSFNDATGVLDTSTSSSELGASFSVSGLPNGKYTIKVNNDIAGQYLIMDSIDVIAPIHSPNTTFGSLSLKDCRNFDSQKDINKETKPIKLPFSIDGVNNLIYMSKGISQVLKLSTGAYGVYFENAFNVRPLVTGFHAFNGPLDMGNSSASDSAAWGYSSVYIQTLNSAATAVDSGLVFVEFTEKLQKDELEE